MFRDMSSRGFTLEEVKGFLAGASRLRVCLLGETIIDEWVDVSVENISQKSRCVAGLETSRVRDRRRRHRRAASGRLRQERPLLHQRPGADEVPKNVTVSPLADSPLVKTRFVDKSTGYRPSSRSSWRCRVSAAMPGPISTTTIWCFSPISATGCSMRRRSTVSSRAIAMRWSPRWSRSTRAITATTCRPSTLAPTTTA